MDRTVEFATIAVVTLLVLIGIVLTAVGWDMSRSSNATVAARGKRVEKWGTGLLIGVIVVMMLCTGPWWLPLV